MLVANASRARSTPPIARREGNGEHVTGSPEGHPAGSDRPQRLRSVEGDSQRATDHDGQRAGKSAVELKPGPQPMLIHRLEAPLV